MNAQGNINRLLIAARQKGKYLRLDSKMFYSDNLNKWLTRYAILEKQKGKWCSIWEGFSKPALIKFLADYYNKIGSDADE